jgi:hypothetical protein
MSDLPEESVVYGLGGAWGFAPADLTSPARAAAAEAFTDSTPAAGQLDFTELRVHGVSGSNGPTMLEHPNVLQVAGDTTTMFYRRWTPAGPGGKGVPWKLEAYSWGGLTENALRSASWLLFAPFMLYNVAHFALPPPKKYQIDAGTLSRDRWHAWAAALLRLLAFAATVQFVTVIVSTLVSTVALQAGTAHFPSWLSWYPHWPAGERVRLALAGVAVVIAVMWLISIRTANLYEARISPAEAPVNDQWPLTQTRFWMGQQLVSRHRSLHTGGAAAAIALVVSRPAADMGSYRLVVMSVAALVVALVLVTLCLPIADRHDTTLAHAPDPSSQVAADKTAGTRWCRVLLGAGAVAFAGAFCTSDWSIALPGFISFCAFLLVAQALLLLVLAVIVLTLSRRAPDPARLTSTSQLGSGQAADHAARTAPFGAGQLTTILAVLAVCLGGIFSAVIDLFVVRFLGTPVPSGIQFHKPPLHPLQVPWPIYAFGFAPLGLLVLALPGLWVFCTYCKNVRTFKACTPGDAQTSGSPVSKFYGIYFGSAGPDSREATDYKRNCTTISRAWAVGLLADQAAVVAAWAAAGLVAATAVAQIYSAQSSHHMRLYHSLQGFVAVESFIGLIAAGGLIYLLRLDFSNPARRKTIGVLWDVATFWPRATHPFAPPCYAERAIPELVDRIRILTGTVRKPLAATDPAAQQIIAHERNSGAGQSPHLTIPVGQVLLTGYSQGAILATAAVAQLPAPTREKLALLTLASPARRLHGRAFPAYFGEHSLRTLACLLNVCPQPRDAAAGSGESFTGGRWKNLRRPTDYIGSWIFNEPVRDYPANSDGAYYPADSGWTEKEVDQPCWDPVSLAADIDPTPPPIHRHTGFWPDPRVTQLGRNLGILLGLDPAASSSQSAGPSSEAPALLSQDATRVDEGQAPDSD